MFYVHDVRAPYGRGHTTLNSHISVGHNNSQERPSVRAGVLDPQYFHPHMTIRAARTN